MLRIKRLEGEDMGTFLHRANGILRDGRRHNNEHEHGDTRATELRYKWGGQVARFRRLDPSRLTFRVFSHWNYKGMVDGLEE